MVDRLTAAWFHILSALQAKPRCLLAVGRCDSIWSYCLVRVSGDVNCYLPPKGYAPEHLYLGFYNLWVPAPEGTRPRTEQLPWLDPIEEGLG
jgi:hypothetical protein